ncbi:MAG: HAD-IIB family hydrolase [Patescibacteria group bacterium]
MKTPKGLLKRKKIIIFDIDGTIAKSKMPIDKEMAKLLSALLVNKKVVLVSGEKYTLFKKQIVSKLSKTSSVLKNLVLLPTNAAMFYVYKNSRWVRLYNLRISKKEEAEILKQFYAVLKRVGFKSPQHRHGKIIEYRGTEVVFSALGQKAPLSEKNEWNKKHDMRGKIKNILERKLPGFDAKVAGLTSIDIIREGIDKAYGLKKVKKYFNVKTKDILFVGDMIIPGGNDYPVVKTGVEYIKVNSPKETKKVIQSLLS